MQDLFPQLSSPETWIIWGDEEIIGERDGFIGNLLKYVNFWARIPDRGIKITKYTDQQEFSYYPGIHNLALLDLFGFLSVRSGKPAAGKGWRIAQLQRLPFGDAMLRLLFVIYNKKGFVWESQGNVNVTFGELQTHFKPFFPEWENNLVLSSSEFTEGIYVFKVSLAGAWRRIAIPAQLELDWLSGSILDAFDFDRDHLYEFRYKDRFGRIGQVGHPYCGDSLSTAEVRLGELPLQPGDPMIFLFDFGDNWEFDVQLKEIQPPSAEIKKPEILATRGKAPKQYWDEWDEEEDWEEEDY